MRSVRYTSRAGDPPAIFQKADCDPAQGLFERARCGAPGARGRLIEHYTPILRRRARGLMRLHHDDGALQAEDVVQDTLLSVLPHLPEFQPREYHRFQKYLGKTLKSKTSSVHIVQPSLASVCLTASKSGSLPALSNTSA